ncbi:MAG: sigma-70 family RNA polymerase sigma factor [Saprospiraceae bacterium]
MHSDQELVYQLRNKDEKTIKYFIRKYQNYIYTICFGVLKSKEEAEEASQDTFLKILNAISTYTPNGKITTWMYTVAYRTSLDYLKKRKRTIDIYYFDAGSAVISDNILLETEKKAVINQLINQLSSEDAGLIRMYYLGEMSIKELSSELKLTENNIKVKLYRARKILLKLATKLEYFSDLLVK